MPQDFRKRGRGRRGQEKEKKEKILDQLRAQADEDEARPAKRQRLSPQPEVADLVLDQPDYPPVEEEQANPKTYHVLDVSEDAEAQDDSTQSQFFGLLDDTEQAFLKRIDLILANESYESPDEKPLFLGNTWNEVRDKELKIASSQSCSRVLERLIKASEPVQLKGAWARMQGNFLTLVQHRFASHVVEALLISCAPYVSKELLSTDNEEVKGEEPDEYADYDTRAVSKSMEEFYLELVEELGDNLGFLMTNQFASHTLRVLLLVLAGRPLTGSGATMILQSKKKEKIVPREALDSTLSQSRVIPDSFPKAITNMSKSTLAGLDTNYLRAVATNPLANPVLQLFLELEFAADGKQKAKDESSLYRRLLPDDPPSEETQSAAFIKGLLFDPVGSRLLETIIQCAPGKTFKVIYRNLFKENLSSVVRNEVAGFVVVKILERLSHDELQNALLEIQPQIGTLFERSRHSVVKCLVERCRARGVDMKGLANSISDVFGGIGQALLAQLLQPSVVDESKISADRRPQIEHGGSSKLHASVLAQKMLAMPDHLQSLILDSLLACDSNFLLLMASDRTATHVLQAALNPDCVDKSHRRPLVQKLTPMLMELALNRVSSHVVDALAGGTSGLQYLRDKIAEELSRNESRIRDSEARILLKNWMVGLYQRRRGDWVTRMREQTGEAASSSEHDGPFRRGQPPAATSTSARPRPRAQYANAQAHEKPTGTGKALSGIEAARARFAENQRGGGGKFGGHARRGGNMGAVRS